ncbi:MAG: hypothetical protein AAF525_04930 [Pseudomonadota bacterium]
MQKVTTTQVDLALDRAETTSGTITNPERIGYLAIPDGTLSFTAGIDTIDLESIQSADNVTNSCTTVTFTPAYFSSEPIVVASQNTRDGGDGGWLRRCNVGSANTQVRIQEDVATDTDVSHTTERAGVVAISGMFAAGVADIGTRMEAHEFTINTPASASLSFTPISFSTPFTSIPRVFVLPTTEESDPASTRLRNITVAGFEVAQVQPTGEFGAADSMTVDYIAIADGIHAFDNDTALEVGTISTTQVRTASPPFAGTGAYATLNFNYTGFTTPIVLFSIQSTANEVIDPSSVSAPWLTVAAEGATSTDVQVALERAEADDGGSVSFPETIAYVAIEDGSTGSFDPGSGLIQFEAQRVGGIQGFTNGCFDQPFLTSFSVTPLVVASQSSRAGVNGGWVRRCNIDADDIGLTIDEDRTFDTDRSHISETVDLLAFSAAFEGELPQPNLDVVLVTDITSVDTGGTVTYTATVTNIGGNNADNVLVEDGVSEFLSIVMDAFGVDTPFQFNGGVPHPTLTMDTPVYSNNGGIDYTYDPVDTGSDPNVTDWRVPFTGLLPSGGSFTLEYQLQVQ